VRKLPRCFHGHPAFLIGMFADVDLLADVVRHRNHPSSDGCLDLLDLVVMLPADINNYHALENRFDLPRLLKPGSES